MLFKLIGTGVGVDGADGGADVADGAVASVGGTVVVSVGEAVVGDFGTIEEPLMGLGGRGGGGASEIFDEGATTGDAVCTGLGGRGGGVVDLRRGRGSSCPTGCSPPSSCSAGGVDIVVGVAVLVLAMSFFFCVGYKLL